MVNLIPPNGRPNGNDILKTDMLCKDTQRTTDQTEGSPRLKAAAGSFVALRYQENGHVTLPQNQPGKPANRGNVYIYGTTEPKPDETLLSIHKVWNSDGSGGDKRGVLLATQAFDDAQCYQVNGGQISTSRQTGFKHAANKLMGADLWCQNDIKIPSDAPAGKPYTLYWVWDWPTAPGADPGLPKGKAEIYTTCMDVDITPANQQKSVAKYMDGQPLDNAAIKSYLNADASQPTGAAQGSSSTSSLASSQPTTLSTQAAPTQQPASAPKPDSCPSMPTSSSGQPAAVPQVTGTAVGVSQIADGQPQVPVPATSQAPAAPSQPAAVSLSSQPAAPQPSAEAAGGTTTVYVTKTVYPSATTSTVLGASSSAAPASSGSSGYKRRNSAKFRFL